MGPGMGIEDVDEERRQSQNRRKGTETVMEKDGEGIRDKGSQRPG